MPLCHQVINAQLEAVRLENQHLRQTLFRQTQKREDVAEGEGHIRQLHNIYSMSLSKLEVSIRSQRGVSKLEVSIRSREGVSKLEVSIRSRRGVSQLEVCIKSQEGWGISAISITST